MQFLERFTFGSHEIEYELVGETVTSLKLIQRHERDLCSLDEEIPMEALLPAGNVCKWAISWVERAIPLMVSPATFIGC